MSAQVSPEKFLNPIIDDGADPWAIAAEDGFYYYTQTNGRTVDVRRSATLLGLRSATPVTVFTPSGAYTQNVWAPELHFIRGKWYIYYAADNGSNPAHRMFVAEAADPLGPYTSKGKIYDPTADYWAIDGTVLDGPSGQLYFIWSGWPGTRVDQGQQLYIAPMSDPWTLSGPRVLLASGDQPWEAQILEGPETLQRNGKFFVIYSANASWTDNYCLGMLVNPTGDFLNPSAWIKNPGPVFSKFADANDGVYGPGHPGFVRSLDGKQDWILYHAAKLQGSGWVRNIRTQPFGWTADGAPFFGHPIPTGTALTVPSGEGSTSATARLAAGNGLQAEYYRGTNLLDLAFTQIDPTVDFDWDASSPAPALPADRFSVRWTGWLQPKTTDLTTFAIVTDDGARLWIDDQLLIDNWRTQVVVEKKAAFPLDANRVYRIRLEYFENAGKASARLFWSSPTLHREIIPASQIYSSQPPEIRLITPADGSSFAPGSIIAISAEATAGASPIRQVQFMDGSRLLATLTNPPFALNWQADAAGPFSLVALATDLAGMTRFSTPAQVAITPPPDLPPHGWRAIYFTNSTNANVDFSFPILSIIQDTLGNLPNDPALIAAQPRQISAKYQAYCTARFSEDYSFFVRAPNRFRLLLDGEELIDAREPALGVERAGRASLIAGKMHRLEVDVIDGLSSNSVALAWTSSHQPKESLPLSQTFVSGPAIETVQLTDSGSVRIQIAADSAKSCVVSVSNDLQHWHPLSTNQIAAGGILEITDPIPAAAALRFYRVRQL